MKEYGMSRFSSLFASLLIGALAVPASQTALVAQTAPGWVTLFDGTSLDKWVRTGDANWALKDGLAQADKGFGHLVSKELYGDFELRAEFWADEPANSGIFIRCSEPANPLSTSCYEVNIFDTRPEQKYATGAIVDFAPVQAVQKAGGKWNTLEIRAVGDHLTVVLNGQKTAEVHDKKFQRGPVTLQYGSGLVKFRKVEIRTL
jgi:hypothetical protein